MRIENWIDDSSLASITYAGYWNDEGIEQSKEAFWVVDGDFRPMDDYLARSQLVADIEHCVELLRTRGLGLRGIGLDLAAGPLWAVPILFRLGEIEHLTCVEISKHRLLRIGPLVLDHYGAPKDRVTLAYGSFYDLRVPKDSADFALLNQAFHHAAEPMRLLAEMRRVLRPDGVVLMVGEHRRTSKLRQDLTHSARYIAGSLPATIQKAMRGRCVARPPTLVARGPDIFPPDELLGDHYYLDRDYRRMFRAAGFKAWKADRPKSPCCSYVLVKR